MKQFCLLCNTDLSGRAIKVCTSFRFDLIGHDRPKRRNKQYLCQECARKDLDTAHKSTDMYKRDLEMYLREKITKELVGDVM